MRYARPVNYAQLLFPDFSLILGGYLICRFTALNRAVWQPVEGLVYYLLFPVLLFQSIVRNPINVHEASGLMAAGLLLCLGGIALAYALPHLPGIGQHMPARTHAGAAQVAFRFNSFMGLALAERVAGSQGLQMIAVLIGVCVPLLNVAAVWPMARQGEHHFLRELLRNPLIIATVSGLAANLLGLAIPGWMAPTVSRIGNAAQAQQQPGGHQARGLAQVDGAFDDGLEQQHREQQEVHQALHRLPHRAVERRVAADEVTGKDDAEVRQQQLGVVQGVGREWSGGRAGPQARGVAVGCQPMPQGLAGALRAEFVVGRELRARQGQLGVCGQRRAVVVPAAAQACAGRRLHACGRALHTRRRGLQYRRRAGRRGG